MMWTNDFQEPKDIQESRERRRLLVIEQQDIQSQLANMDKHNEKGERMSNVEYHQWRSRATSALKIKVARIQMLKLWEEQKREDSETVIRWFPDTLAARCLPPIEDELIDMCAQVESVFARMGATAKDDYGVGKVVEIASRLLPAVLEERRCNGKRKKGE